MFQDAVRNNIVGSKANSASFFVNLTGKFVSFLRSA